MYMWDSAWANTIGMQSPFESDSGAQGTLSFRDIFYQLIVHYPLRCLPPVNGRFTLAQDGAPDVINYRRMFSLPMILVANLPFSKLAYGEISSPASSSVE
ncbi:uncharacterized protein ARMOST_11180 [Armillaria ostoyae]|uniref:Uncharacterized protein n=1 Tax=Armillaria ostoyae TaxID=47428 RepID=A0A284RGF3_ARMOS|nr:uncharacterized protein ARMOST_11180 [Armillaria ostoyae]